MSNYFLSSFIRKWRRRRLRFIFKGFKILKKENNLSLLVQILDLLTKTRLNNVRLPKHLFQKNGINVELSVRQYVSVRTIFSLSFNKAVLYSIGSNKPLRYPLPKVWQDALGNQTFKVDRFVCTILWKGYILLIWAYGVLKGFKSIFYLLKKCKKLKNHIYFHNLKANNIPKNNKENNIINWYLQWGNRTKKIDTICHSVRDTSNVTYGNINIFYIDGLPYLSSIQIVRYSIWFLCLALYSLLIGLFNPNPAIMLNESIKLLRIKLAKKDQLANDYLFHNSASFYRPLWTYEAQKKGARILFYFYSCNIEPLKLEKSIKVDDSYHLLSWPHYLVWDKYQADFIKRADQHNSIIEEVGPIWFSSNVDEFTPTNQRAIAVFDITPARLSFFITLAAAHNEFHVPEVVNQFLNDIQSVLRQNNYIMLHKMKRLVSFDHKKYKFNIRALKEKSNYQQLSPEVDATILIRNSVAAISMPFTSTALIAKDEGKPSIYYDPSGIIHKDDRAAHGIKVLTSIDELQTWVQSINKE